MKKMIFIILLFVTLTCLVCEPFEVRSAQTIYQVSKNADVTLEWTFTKSSLDSLVIFCYVIIDQDRTVLLDYSLGREYHNNGLFEGRVQLDKDLLRERRIRLHVSSLRTEDSGLYQCEVKTSEGSDWGLCRVTVTAELQTIPETKTETEPEPEDRKTGNGVWIGLSIGLTVLVICVCGITRRGSYNRVLKPLSSFIKKTGGNDADRNTSKAGQVVTV